MKWINSLILFLLLFFLSVPCFSDSNSENIEKMTTDQLIAEAMNILDQKEIELTEKEKRLDQKEIELTEKENIIIDYEIFLKNWKKDQTKKINKYTSTSFLYGIGIGCVTGIIISVIIRIQ